MTKGNINDRARLILWNILLILDISVVVHCLAYLSHVEKAIHIESCPELSLRNPEENSIAEHMPKCIHWRISQTTSSVFLYLCPSYSDVKKRWLYTAVLEIACAYDLSMFTLRCISIGWNNRYDEIDRIISLSQQYWGLFPMPLDDELIHTATSSGNETKLMKGWRLIDLIFALQCVTRLFWYHAKYHSQRWSTRDPPSYKSRTKCHNYSTITLNYSWFYYRYQYQMCLWQQATNLWNETHLYM